MATTFTKLRNGTWGLRSTETLKTGTVVQVNRSNGSIVPTPVGKWIWSGGNPTVHIYEQGEALPAPEDTDEAPGEEQTPAPAKPTKSELWARAKSEVGGPGALAEDLYRELLDEHGYVPEPKVSAPVIVEEPKPTLIAEPTGPAVMPNKDIAAMANGVIAKEKVNGVTSLDEQKLKTLDSAVRTFGKDVWQLVYDLVRVCAVTDPDGTNPRRVPQTTVPDPAGDLWQRGFPYTQSVWVMTQDQKDSKEMKTLTDLWDNYPGYMEYHWTRVDRRDVEAMREIARNRLAKMLREVHTSLITRIDAAHAAWQKADVEFAKAEKTVSWQERQKLEASRCNKIRAVIREAADDLNNAIKRAEDFDERGGIEDLISGLRLAIRSSVNSFNAHAQTKNVAKVHVKV